MPSAKRVLILALDSINQEALAPHLSAGRMPNLHKLIAAGAHGVLMSTTPAHTAPAWTTLATGKHPGVHGVVNFRRFDPRTQQSRLNTQSDVAHKTVWQVLDDAGLKVGVVGQPQSYPLRPLQHGFVITGFETPTTECDFAAPAALKVEILQKIPSFCFRSERVRDPAAGKDWAQWDDFVHGMDSLSAENENAHALNLHLARSRAWDALFVYYQATDALFHKAWRWCDPQTRQEDGRRAERIDQFFARLDQMIGDILAVPAAQDALVIVCSDHGHGPAEELVRVNGLLADLGYLKRGGLGTQARETWRRITGQRRGKGLGIAVDWPVTRAYMPFEAIAGFIFLNKIGREPFGTVSEAACAALIEELRAKLMAQKSPHSGRTLFDAVMRPSDMYSELSGTLAQADRSETTCYPELFVQPARGFNLVRKLSFGASVELPSEKHRGTHRPEGFFCLSGPCVRAQTAQASIQDIAPTVLAALGQSVPADMTGRALGELFMEGLSALKGAPSTLLASPSGASVYSSDEQKLVEERLADLGYVD